MLPAGLKHALGVLPRFRNPLPEEPEYEEPVRQLCGLVRETLEKAATLGKVRWMRPQPNSSARRGRVLKRSCAVEKGFRYVYVECLALYSRLRCNLGMT